MARRRRIVCFLSAFAAAAAVLLAFEPLPVAAQILDPQRAQPSATRRPQARPATLPGAAEGALSPLEREEENAFSDGKWGADVRVSPAPAAAPAEEALGEWETQTEDIVGPADVLGAEQARRQRVQAAQDGDVVSVSEPLPTPDGVIDVGEPYALADEEDPTLANLRSPADIEAFAGADAGFDPLLLEAVETNPVFSNEVRLFEPEPFAPLGTRIGSFILFAALEADGDYNSNIFASPEALGDTALEVRPSVRLASNWATHALELRASGDLSYHDKYSTEDDRAYLVEALGRLDITRRTDLQGNIAHEEAQESRSAINASSAGTRPDIVVNRGRAAFNHRFNRLSMQARGAIVDTRYGNDVLDGVVQSNSDRNYTLYEEALRPKWEFTPTFLLFADVSVNQREYAIPAYTDGIIRTSTGERYRLGVSFGNFGEFLRGDISLGYGRQAPESPQLQVIDGLLIDANLTWRMTPLTTLLLTATTDVAETTTVGSGGVLERNYGAEVRHSFSTRLVGSAGVGYFTRDFVGGDLNENQFTAATGLEYFLSRYAVLFGRYQHTAFDTTSFDGNYTVEEVQLGVRLRN